mmetsp:Transcript_48158/g.123990  ORF Transcript_48158/g.123990 Transcript_48158/m.123990 type:complete len:237 (-) Transcript_48158:116-826(-)
MLYATCGLGCRPSSRTAEDPVTLLLQVAARSPHLGVILAGGCLMLHQADVPRVASDNASTGRRGQLAEQIRRLGDGQRQGGPLLVLGAGEQSDDHRADETVGMDLMDVLSDHIGKASPVSARPVHHEMLHGIVAVRVCARRCGVLQEAFENHWQPLVGHSLQEPLDDAATVLVAGHLSHCTGTPGHQLIHKGLQILRLEGRDTLLQQVVRVGAPKTLGNMTFELGNKAALLLRRHL